MECWADLRDLDARAVDCSIDGAPLEPQEEGRFEFWSLPAGHALGARSNAGDRRLYAFILLFGDGSSDGFIEIYIERLEDDNMIVTDLVGFIQSPRKGSVARSSMENDPVLFSEGRLRTQTRGNLQPGATDVDMAFMRLTTPGIYVERLWVSKQSVCRAIGAAVDLGESVELEVEGPRLTNVARVETVLSGCDEPVVSGPVLDEVDVGERLVVSAPASNEVLTELYGAACM